MQDILSYYLDIMENEEVIQEKVLGQALGLAAVKTYSAAVASAASATDAVILGRIGYWLLQPCAASMSATRSLSVGAIHEVSQNFLYVNLKVKDLWFWNISSI